MVGLWGIWGIRRSLVIRLSDGAAAAIVARALVKNPRRAGKQRKCRTYKRRRRRERMEVELAGRAREESSQRPPHPFADRRRRLLPDLPRSSLANRRAALAFSSPCDSTAWEPVFSSIPSLPPLPPMDERPADRLDLCKPGQWRSRRCSRSQAQGGTRAMRGGDCLIFGSLSETSL